MARLPSRFRRLDEILADLPVEDPMLLTELDGYLTGVAVAPRPMSSALWLPAIWGGAYGEAAPFEDPIDVQLFADMVLARHREIERDLGRGKAQPIYDVDERTGDIVWEEWVGGFEMAMAVQPDSWAPDEADVDTEVAAAIAEMRTLADIAFDRSALTSIEINEVCDTAPNAIARIMTSLYARRRRPEPVVDVTRQAAKVGRNDPCPCGSGRKHKRCCGAAA